MHSLSIYEQLCDNHTYHVYSILQIQKSCERVLSLNIQEPLMKILAGLEYVLKKSQVLFLQ